MRLGKCVPKYYAAGYCYKAMWLTDHDNKSSGIVAVFFPIFFITITSMSLLTKRKTKNPKPKKKVSTQGTNSCLSASVLVNASSDDILLYLNRDNIPSII